MFKLLVVGNSLCPEEFLPFFCLLFWVSRFNPFIISQGPKTHGVGSFLENVPDRGNVLFKWNNEFTWLQWVCMFWSSCWLKNPNCSLILCCELNFSGVILRIKEGLKLQKNKTNVFGTEFELLVYY